MATYVFVHAVEDHLLELVQGRIDAGPPFSFSDMFVELWTERTAAG